MSEAKSHGSETGSGKFYRVEARATHLLGGEPKNVHGMLLTSEWREIQTVALQSGVAIGADAITVPADPWNSIARDHGFLAREAAYTLALRFQLDSMGRAHLCIETRLVEINLSYGWSAEEMGVTEPLSLFDMLRYLKTEPRVAAPAFSVGEKP